jgi:hypothetical protein
MYGLRCGRNFAHTLGAGHYSCAAPQNIIDFLARRGFSSEARHDTN